MIVDFKEKKVAEYLRPGGKYLIRFGHGLGDTIMFMPAFHKLRELFPGCTIDLYVESGQEEIFKSVPDKDAPGYDEVFSLNFPMSEGSSVTKPALCCIEELGIDPITDVVSLPKKKSPLVAVHFHGTALPESVGWPEEIARQVWGEVKDAGKVPIECHFEHMFHNPVNAKYSFVDSTVRGCKADLHNLIGLIQCCGAFIGVASGPFVVALSVMPDRTFYLEKNHKLETYTTKNVAKANMHSYEAGTITRWLKSLDSDYMLPSTSSSSSGVS